MTLPDLLSLETAGILAAAGAISAFVLKSWPIARRLARFLDDVQGEPARPGVPPRPGWSERLSAIETRVTRIEGTTERVRAQTENSHSTNLRDDLDRIEEKVTDLHTRHIPNRHSTH